MASIPLMVAITSGLAGAVFGALAMWLSDKARDRRLAHESREEGLHEKVHPLEVRLVRLETELGFYAVIGQSWIQEANRAQQE